MKSVFLYKEKKEIIIIKENFVSNRIAKYYIYNNLEKNYLTLIIYNLQLVKFLIIKLIESCKRAPPLKAKFPFI